MSTPAKPLPWYFAPTLVIVSGCLVALVNYGARSSFGLFTGPISEAYAWPRETFSFAMALQNLLWGLAAPVAGAMADRYGSAKVLMVGALVYATGTVLMAFTDSPLALHFSGGVLAGTGIAFSSFSIVMAALGRMVPPEKRSWAFGIVTAASSLGQFIYLPMSAALISAFGWQTTLVILGASVLLIVPLAVPLLKQGQTAGKTPSGEVETSLGKTVRSAMSHPSYLLLVAGFFVCGFQLAVVLVHLPPYLTEHGISIEFAGLAMSAIGLFNVVGAYASGVIGGKYQKRVPLSLIYALRGVAIVAFVLLPVTPATTLVFTASFGLLWLSTVPLTMGLVVVMFGTRYMATLYGIVFISHQLGSFLGSWLGGRVYDQFGSYDPVWWIGAALSLFAALVNLPIRETRAPKFATA